MLEEYIEKNCFDLEDIVEILFQCVKFKKNEWVFDLLVIISKNFASFLKSKNKQLLDLPLDVMKGILNRDDLFVEKEDHVYSFVIDYINKRE
jgi:hypothetical protein